MEIGFATATVVATATATATPVCLMAIVYAKKWQMILTAESSEALSITFWIQGYFVK